MSTEIKVRNLQDDTYQVVEFSLANDDGAYTYEDETVLHQGTLSDCEAFIRLKESGHL